MGCGLLTDSVRDYYDPDIISSPIYESNLQFYTKDGVVHILKGHKDAHTEIDKSKAIRLALCKKCASAYNNL